jgi:hypothetical protein
MKPEDLGKAIAENLTLYHTDIVEKVNKLSEEAAKKLVKKTKATAPTGKRGSFKKNITSRRVKENRNGDTFAWYVKPPDHRLTHLLVKPHATRNGGRTEADPFLANALAEVLPEYENDVQEALKR